MKNIHVEPRAYSGTERGCEMMNMVIDEFKMPDSWKVQVPIESKSVTDPLVFGIREVDREAKYVFEGYMIGLAIASGAISIGKAREWLGIAGIVGNHEMANFGGEVRDELGGDDE